MPNLKLDAEIPVESHRNGCGSSLPKKVAVQSGVALQGQRADRMASSSHSPSTRQDRTIRLKGRLSTPQPPKTLPSALCYRLSTDQSRLAETSFRWDVRRGRFLRVRYPDSFSSITDLHSAALRR